MENKSRAFQMYEKMADKSLKDQKRRLLLTYTLMGLIIGIFAGIGDSVVWLFVGAVFGTCLGILGGIILLKIIQKPYKKLNQLEKSEGYTDATLAEAYTILNKQRSASKQMTYAVIAAMIHNFRGEFSKALDILTSANEAIFYTDPSNAHNYYAVLMTAYLISGDLDHAADTYNRGSYYMRTYMNSPTSGSHVSVSLAVYELYVGHYDVSLQLLENAARIEKDNFKPEDRASSENMSSIIYYWKAVNFASIGDKSAAWECINYCKNFYKTPYYDSLCKKLLDDMAKDEQKKQKPEPEMITDVETFS